MVARTHPVYYGYDDYQRLADDSNVRLEYVGGRIYAMAGGTPEHAALIGSVSRHLGNGVAKTKCRVAVTELRVRVRAADLATYPDLSVIWGPWERDPEDKLAVVNPTVLVE